MVHCHHQHNHVVARRLDVGGGVVVAHHPGKVDPATVLALDAVDDDEQHGHQDQQETHGDAHTDNHLQWYQLK